MLKSLDDITEADLLEIRNMAGVFFTPRQIAIAMEIDQESFIYACQDKNHPCFNAFEGGRLLNEYKVRQSVVKLAISGSSPAQTMALDMIKTSTMKMMDT